MAIYILTDSTADFTREEAERRGVWVVPLKVQFGAEAYRDGIDLDHGEFYRKLAAAKELPTTSQAVPDDFLPFFQRAKEQGDGVICLPLASSLSGTYQSAVIAQEMCGYEGIHVVDSAQTVLGLRLLVDLACLLREQGLGAAGIAAQLEQARGRVKLLAIVDTLKYLHKGGRLPASVAIAGGLLKVKPIVSLQNGELGLAGKGMGARGSLSAIVKLLGEFRHDSRLPVYYGYTADDGLCRELAAQVTEAFGPHRLETHSVGAAIGTHVGPGAAAVAYLEPEGRG